MYSAYNHAPLRPVLPSPNTSFEDLASVSPQSDVDTEFTLFEGSTSESFVWSSASSEIALERDSAEASPERTDAAAPPAPPSIHRAPLPLLRFFATLLAVDEPTLRLLEHPQSTDSPLFRGPSLARPVPEIYTEHGLFTLLDPRSRALKDGGIFWVKALLTARQ